MGTLYARWIHRWERRLHAVQADGRPTERVVRPFEWGAEWVNGQAGEPAPVWDPADSDRLFAFEPPGDYTLSGDRLTFTSPLHSPHPENNTVHARYFPVRGNVDRAVLVMAQWNADEQSHVGLCRLLNLFGIAALRLSLPYHDRRMPPDLRRADYAVSSNVGRTVHANRQAVVDARASVHWLAERGYRRIGILGTSLGSCIAFITTVHEPLIRAQALNHVSTWFADVVWRGLSTSHVAETLKGGITLEELRRHWALISPASYMHRLPGRHVHTLVVWARYDLSFPPDLSQDFTASLRRLDVPFRELVLPCGHYTSGVSPFKWMDGWGLCRFLSEEL